MSLFTDPGEPKQTVWSTVRGYLFVIGIMAGPIFLVWALAVTWVLIHG